jgi:type IV pilus assembly protein PilA
MFCFKCGASMPDTTQACPRCGAVVAAGPQSPPPVSLPGGAAAVPRQYGAPPQTDGKAVGSLILGILAIFPFGLLAGIPAVVLGHLSKSSIAKSMGRLKGEGMATAGLVMGYVSVAFVPLILIIAAIAIPNLLRARIAANESAAAVTVRTVNTAQAAYTTQYPTKGYARNLSTLGPGPSGNCANSEGTEEHACMLNGFVGAARCVDGVWCFNRQHTYMYMMNAVCSEGTCSDYMILAAPVNPGTTGSKSFCSTSDAIIRVGPGRSPEPLSLEACKSWPPLT